jgi:serine protease
MQIRKYVLRSVALVSLAAVGQAHAWDPNDRIVVKFRDNSAASLQPTTALRSLAPGAQPIVRLANGAQVLHVARGQADATIARLSKNRDVQYAERDVLVRRAQVNDPWYRGVIELVPGRGYGNVQADLYDRVGGVNAPVAWTNGGTGNGVVVAVLDTGITRHPDLDANVVPGAGYDFITNPFMSGRTDTARTPGGWDTGDWTHLAPYLGACTAGTSSWHGTHVAGTIAAVTNNGQYMAGMAYDAKLLPMRVLGHCGGQLSDIAAAVTWASGGSIIGLPDNTTPAEVLNLSLGGPAPCPQYMQEAIDGAVSRGSTIVVAAGNSNQDASKFTPANCRNVIVVGSSGLTGRRAFYSNWGDIVTVSAPGGGRFQSDQNRGELWRPGGFIWSTHNAGKTGPQAPSMAGMTGTSMAAPHVAAIVAMMQSVAPTPHTPAKIAQLLADSARMFPMPIDKPIGTGIADAGRAVEAAKLGYVTPPAPVEVFSNRPVLHLNGRVSQTRHYMIDVPASAKRLTLRSYGGAGDADLYARLDQHAFPDAHDAKSVRPGNNSVVVIDAPAAGKWHIAVHGAKAFSAVSLRATVE